MVDHVKNLLQKCQILQPQQSVITPRDIVGLYVPTGQLRSSGIAAKGQNGSSVRFAMKVSNSAATVVIDCSHRYCWVICTHWGVEFLRSSWNGQNN